MTNLTPIANDLTDLVTRVTELELEAHGAGLQDHETVYRYYYGKGALDYRDKLLAVLGGLPMTSVAAVAYELVRDTFPDEYPGPSS